jgi:hypothetical protein
MSNPNLYVKKRTTVNEIFNNDPERIELYNKIVESLITAGYFRARINSLEPFDKILGGMAWILTGCFYDIDIEFKDEMNLTEKIRVSEKVVAGLKAINCPMTLNPVQIQGLDLKPLYQTLQWLQKRLLETRDERNALNKKISVNFYNKEYINIDKNKLKLSNDTDEMLKTKYNILKENRKYKPKNKLTNLAPNYNDELRVFFSMIEFGVKDIAFQRQFIELLKKRKIIEDKNKNNQSTTIGGGIGKMQTNNETQDKLTKEEMKILNDVMNNNIEEISNQENKQKVNTSIIEAIFSENMAYITKEIENFDNIKGDENIDKIKLYAKEKERLEQNKNNIISQINQYNTELDNCKEQEKKEKEEINKLQEEIEKLRQTKAQNERNKETILQKIKEEKISEEKLAFLSEKNKRKEELKSNISKFKKECLAEKKIYDAQLENYQKKIDKLNDSENIAVFNEIDVNYNAELQKNTEKKKDLFNQNKIINMLTRKIQLYPSKLEIIQYQKRFQELYDQINKISERSTKILRENHSKGQVIALLKQKEQVFNDLKTMYQSIKPKEKDKFKVTINNVTLSLGPSLTNSSNRLKEYSENIDKNQKQLNDYRLHESNYLRLIKEYNKEYNKYSSAM